MAGTSHANEVTLEERDLARISSGAIVAPRLFGLERVPGLGPVDSSDQSEAAQILRRSVARGRSQGFDRILYDNRDRAHSILPRGLFPNLTFVTYGPKLLKARLDYGVAGDIFIPALVFGNSSTAVTSGPAQRSLARLAMTTAGVPARSYRDYVSNSLYIYPEHVDHDAVDLYPANWPYLTVSQGSSGSDKPLMRAIAMTLAAFPGETRAVMEKAGLVAPTVQMILRRNLTLIRTRAQYFSGAAHPSVFDHRWLRPARMVAQAAAMTPDQIPPLVRLKVLTESFAATAGLSQRSEQLFTTPSAIARIWRGADWVKEMTLDAGNSLDIKDRALRFDWVILRGDPQRIEITPLDGGRKARIKLLWHPQFTLHPRVPGKDQARLTSRVDIGVFANNGVSDSAPAIISVSFPTHHDRLYAPAPNGDITLKSVDYDANGRKDPFDPLLHWSAPWRDEFAYDENGVLIGWDRHDARGVTRFDADGRPPDGLKYRYIVSDLGKTPPILQIAPDSGK